MSNILVTFFSASGVTKKVAKEIASVEKADLFEIIPEVPYTEQDLDWKDKNSRSTVEMNDLNCRPAISSKKADIEKYDTIFIGFPIWWGREPSIIDTFLDSYDFSGKKIIPFCTSGGSGIGDTSKRIKEIVGNSADVDSGKRLGGNISEKDLELWTNGFHINDASKHIDEETMKKLIAFQQAELDGVVTYQTLEKLTDDEKLKEVFKKTAADEGRHASILKSYTGAVLTPSSETANKLAQTLKAIGMPALLETISKVEYDGYDLYRPYADKFPLLVDIMADEHKHGNIMSDEASRLKEKN